MKSISDSMPFSKLMGVDIVKYGKEEIVGKLLIRPDLCTSGFILHGGAIMAFADALGAIGAFITLPEGATGTTTIESKTNFLGVAKENTIIIGTARPLKLGKRLSVWQTEIRSDDGRQVATVSQTQLVL